MKRIKYSNLLILGVIIYLLTYGALYAVGNLTKIYTLENVNADMKISAKGLVIRDEKIIKSPDEGTVEFNIEEGKKVQNEETIASIYLTDDYKSVEDEIEQIETEITEHKEGENNISTGDIENLNEEIANETIILQERVMSGEYDGTKDHAKKIDDLIEEKDRLMNNPISTKQLEVKEDQKEMLEEKQSNNKINIASEGSGIISYSYDNYTYGVDDLGEITKDEIDKAENNLSTCDISSVKENEYIGRIVNNNETYIAISTNEKDSNEFEVGQQVKIHYEEKYINAKVNKKYKDGENFTIIFKISDQNIGIIDTRVGEFDIIYKQIEGVQIDKESIDTVDGTEGVYIIDEETKYPKFTPLDGISYEDDESIFIDSYSNSINGIESADLYDRIISKPNFFNTKIKISK